MERSLCQEISWMQTVAALPLSGSFYSLINIQSLYLHKLGSIRSCLLFALLEAASRLHRGSIGDFEQS